MKVILLMASTVDGKISRNSNQFVDWTGKADKNHFVEATKKAGAVIMGSKTYDTIGKPLPGRFNWIMTKDVMKSFEGFHGSNDFLFSQSDPKSVLKSLNDSGYTSVCLIGGATVNSLFAKKNLIDEVQITITPKLFGTGLSLFSEQLDMDLSFKSCKEIGDGSVVLTYDVIK